MKRKWLITGSEKVGKTTLANFIEKEDYPLKKTLDLRYRANTIEVPSEFIAIPYLNNAVIMIGQNQSLANLFLIDLEKTIHFPPNYARSFTRKSICIIMKTDLYSKEQLSLLWQKAKAINANDIIGISFKTGVGLEQLEKRIKEIEESQDAFYNRR